MNPSVGAALRAPPSSHSISFFFLLTLLTGTLPRGRYRGFAMEVEEEEWGLGGSYD